MQTKLLNYWKRIERKLPRKRAARVQLIMFGVIALLAISITPVVVLVKRSDVDIRQQAYTDPATGESCGWCAGPDQCFAATGHAPEAGSSAACAGGACCTGFSAGGGGGSSGGGGGTTPAAAKGVGANCVLGGSADPPEGCDGAGPLICAYCNDAMNKAGQSVCSFTEDGGTQHIAACGGLKGQTGSGQPAVCTVGQRSECGVDGCVANQQRLCDAFGQWGPCVNATQCGYTGANNGVACSQDIHCKSGFCDPNSKTCSDPQPSCYTAADNCLSHNPQNCDSSQSFSTYSACSVAVAPGCYVTDDECQSDNPQNCEDSGAFQSQADCQAALEEGQGGITPRCYVESDGCSTLTLANCQADDSHTTYAACSVNTLDSCYTPSNRCQGANPQNCELSDSTTSFEGCRSAATLSSCTATCNRASGCFCPSGCQNTTVGSGQQCSPSTTVNTSNGSGGQTSGTPSPSPSPSPTPTQTSQTEYGSVTSCTQVCSDQRGCLCPLNLNCVNSFAQFGTQCGAQPSGGGREVSLIPDNIGQQTGTQTVTPTPTASPQSGGLSQIANTIGQAGGSQTTSQQTTTAPSTSLGIAPSLPPSQTATPTQGSQQVTADGTTSLGLLLQPTTTPTSQLDAILRDETPSAANQTVRPTAQPLATGLTATPTETEEPEVTVPEQPTQPQNPLQRAIAAVTGRGTTTTTTTTATSSPLTQLTNAIASSGVGRFFGLTPTETESTQPTAQQPVASTEETQLQDDIFGLQFQIYAEREACLTDFANDYFRDPQLRRFCEPEDLKEELNQRIADDPLCQQNPEGCQQVRDELQAQARTVYVTQANQAQASYLTRSCGTDGDDPADIDFNCIKQVEDEVVALENEITETINAYCEGREDEETCREIRPQITQAVAVSVQEQIDYENTQEELVTAWQAEEQVRGAINRCNFLLEEGQLTEQQHQACLDPWTFDSDVVVDNVQTVIDRSRVGSCYNEEICEAEAELIAVVETKLDEYDQILDQSNTLARTENAAVTILGQMTELNCYEYPNGEQCVALQAELDQLNRELAVYDDLAQECGRGTATGGYQASIISNPFSDLSNLSCVELISNSYNTYTSVDEYQDLYSYESQITNATEDYLQADHYIRFNCSRDEVVDQAECDRAEQRRAEAQQILADLDAEVATCTDENPDNRISACQNASEYYAASNSQIAESNEGLNEFTDAVNAHFEENVEPALINAAESGAEAFYCYSASYCLIYEPGANGGISTRAVTLEDLQQEFYLSPERLDQLLGNSAFASSDQVDGEFDPTNPGHVLTFGGPVYRQWYQDDTRPARVCFTGDQGGTNCTNNFAAQTGIFYAAGDSQYIKSCTSTDCVYVRISDDQQRDDDSIRRRAAEIMLFEEGYDGFEPENTYEGFVTLYCERYDFANCITEREVEFYAYRDEVVSDFLDEIGDDLTVDDAANILFRNDPNLTPSQRDVLASYPADFGGQAYLGPDDDLADPEYLYQRAELTGLERGLNALENRSSFKAASGFVEAGYQSARTVGSIALHATGADDLLGIDAGNPLEYIENIKQSAAQGFTGLYELTPTEENSGDRWAHAVDSVAGETYFYVKNAVVASSFVVAPVAFATAPVAFVAEEFIIEPIVSEITGFAGQEIGGFLDEELGVTEGSQYSFELQLKEYGGFLGEFLGGDAPQLSRSINFFAGNDVSVDVPSLTEIEIDPNTFGGGGPTQGGTGGSGGTGGAGAGGGTFTAGGSGPGFTAPTIQVDSFGEVTVFNQTAPSVVQTTPAVGSSNFGGGFRGVASSVFNAPTTAVSSSLTLAQSITQNISSSLNTVFNQAFGGPDLVPANAGVAADPSITQVAGLNRTQQVNTDISGPRDLQLTSFINTSNLDPNSPTQGVTTPTRATTEQIAQIGQGTTNRSTFDAVSEAQARIAQNVRSDRSLDEVISVDGRTIAPADTVSPALSRQLATVTQESLINQSGQTTVARSNFYALALDQLAIQDPVVTATINRVRADSPLANTTVGSALGNEIFLTPSVDPQAYAQSPAQVAAARSEIQQRVPSRNPNFTTEAEIYAANAEIGNRNARAARFHDYVLNELQSEVAAAIRARNQANTPIDITTTNVNTDVGTNPFADSGDTDTNLTLDNDTNLTPVEETTEVAAQPTTESVVSPLQTVAEIATQIEPIISEETTTTTGAQAGETETGGPQLADTNNPFNRPPELDQLLQEQGIDTSAPTSALPSQETTTETTTDTETTVTDTEATSLTEPVDTTDTQLSQAFSPGETTSLRRPDLAEVEEDVGPLALTDADRAFALRESQVRRPAALDEYLAQSVDQTRVGRPTEPFATEPTAEIEAEEVTEPVTVTTPDSFIGRLASPSHIRQNFSTLRAAHDRATRLAELGNGTTFALRVSRFPVTRFLSNATLHLYSAFSGLSAQELAEKFWSIELNNGAYKSTRTASNKLTGGEGNYDDVIALDFNTQGDFNQTVNQAAVITSDIFNFYNKIRTEIMPRVDYTDFSSSGDVTFAVVQPDGSLNIYQMSKPDVTGNSVRDLNGLVRNVLNAEPAAVIPSEAMAMIDQQLLSGQLHYGKPITESNVTPGNAVTRFFNDSLVDQQGIELLNSVQTMYNFNSNYILTKDAATTRVLPSAHHSVHISPIIPGTTNGRNLSMQFNHGIVNGVSALQDFFAGTTDVLINDGVARARSEYHIETDPDSNTQVVRAEMDEVTFEANDEVRKEIKARAKNLGFDFGRGYGKYDVAHRALIRGISEATGETYAGHFLSAIGNNSEFIAPAIVVVGDVDTEVEALAASSEEKVAAFEGRGLASMYGGISQSIQNRASGRNILNTVGKITFGPQTDFINGMRNVMLSIVPGLEGRSVGFSTAQNGRYGVVIGMVDNIEQNGTIDLRFDIGSNVSAEEAAAIRGFIQQLDLNQLIQQELAFEQQALDAYEAQQQQ